MARPSHDLTGQRFGRLVAIRRAENLITPGGASLTRWLCECDCGKTTIVLSRALKAGTTRSCGCLRRDLSRTSAYSKNLKRYKGTSVSMIEKKAPTKASSTGVRGVYWDSGRQAYVARIMLHKKEIFLGSYTTLEAAANARKQAESALYDPLIEEYTLLAGKNKK